MSSSDPLARSSDDCLSDILDMKPKSMEELTEVITAATFHPSHCNVFLYSSSRGCIKMGDMRASALCDKHAKGKPATECRFIIIAERCRALGERNTADGIQEVCVGGSCIYLVVLISLQVFSTASVPNQMKYVPVGGCTDMLSRARMPNTSVLEKPAETSAQSFFSEIVASISDIKSTSDGRYIVSRDYMTLKLWDVNMEARPVKTINVHEHLRPQVVRTFPNSTLKAVRHARVVFALLVAAIHRNLVCEIA